MEEIRMLRETLNREKKVLAIQQKRVNKIKEDIVSKLRDHLKVLWGVRWYPSDCSHMEHNDPHLLFKTKQDAKQYLATKSNNIMYSDGVTWTGSVEPIDIDRVSVDKLIRFT